jgi:hypothetical protein
MPKRIVADPESGFPGKIEDGGKLVEGFYKFVAYVYGPGEVPPAGIDRATIAELRAKYWDPARRALVIPRHIGTFEFGSKLLSHATDTTVVHIRPEFLIPGRFPRPKAVSQ